MPERIKRPETVHYIGMMSGTSCDGIDAVLLALGPSGPQIVCHHYHAYADMQRDRLLALCRPGDDEITRLGAADRDLGETFAQAALTLLREAGMDSDAVRAIGCHGQTVRHQPPDRHLLGYTLQIGDPNTIAERSGIMTVADFRRRDMAAGGQGAPLACAFHHYAFGDAPVDRAVLNLGGIANLTLLPRDGEVTGHDTGPANVLLDYWVQANRDARHDNGGAWAADGRVLESLLDQLASHAYFALAPPKSTGREDFNGDWLERQLSLWRDANASRAASASPQDVQATLSELTAVTVARSLTAHAPQTRELLVCGGGEGNTDLLARMQRCWSGKIERTDSYGIPATQVEASAFAWLAHQRLEAITGNIDTVTGAAGGRVLGGVWPA